MINSDMENSMKHPQRLDGLMSSGFTIRRPYSTLSATGISLMKSFAKSKEKSETKILRI